MIIALPEISNLLAWLVVDGATIPAGIVPHEKWLPSGSSLPFLGIRHAGSVRSDLTCAVVETAATINLVANIRMDSDAETAICGDVGALAIVDAATSILLASWETLTGCQAVEVLKDHPSDVFQTENNQIIVQIVRSLLVTVQR